MPKHEFIRVRQEVVRRMIRVAAKEQITPRMLRVVFHSEELHGFKSPSPDDHIKIILPAKAGQPAPMRDFTPRVWDAEANTLTLDFALHPHGPAVDWAQTARVGDTLEIGGPRGSTVVPDDFDWYLLIGDATALPSIARRLESLPSDATVSIIAIVEDEKEAPYLAHVTQRPITYVFMDGASESAPQQVLDTLRSLRLPAGDGFIWVSAETEVARAIHRYAVGTLGHPKEWIKAAGYWSAGKPEGGERIA